MLSAILGLTPLRIKGDLSDNEKFLIEMEYDGRPGINRGPDGVEYTNRERAEMLQIIGDDKVLANKLTKIRKKAEKANFFERIRKARAESKADVIKSDEFLGIKSQIDAAFNEAVNLAERKLSNRDDIDRTRSQNRRIDSLNRRGKDQELKNLLPPNFNR